MTRSTKEVFESHLLLTLTWDYETDILTNYSKECTIITSKGIFYGHEGLKKAQEMLNDKFAEADYLYTTKLWVGQMAFLEWQALADNYYINDGAETFYIHNGFICAQSIHYTVRSR